jgi:DNA-binding MarR family transcriptional regulator
MLASRKRKELEQIVGLEIGREMSARTILFHQAIADVVGVSVTDMKCLDYIHRGENISAGDLARLTGLTTGAITAAVDRLEKAGLARRERSATDRRKVYIRLCNSPVAKKILPIYEALGREMAQLVTCYSTRELETIHDFCLRCVEIIRRQTEAVQNLVK